ncbi:hypothetical protein PMAYCL1PPCAC_01509 [Pristionchus mayeri]|uniref:C2H2-type domain-containing protein n=1 Tax=Pristionchus mayeri TaxID=1317129 RepID=A0AAN4Z101_9BILA|nr:hypothetical protein PMAYCL1PPCAC_01509 [Pristionchus mayeri]
MQEILEQQDTSRMGSAEPLQSMHRCASCDMPFKTKIGCRTHILKVHAIVTCPKCNLQCEGNDSMKLHYEDFHVFRKRESRMLEPTPIDFGRSYHDDMNEELFDEPRPYDIRSRVDNIRLPMKIKKESLEIAKESELKTAQLDNQIFCPSTGDYRPIENDVARITAAPVAVSSRRTAVFKSTNVFRCSTCYLSCETELSLETHMQRAHIIPTCPKYTFQCEGSDALKKHYKNLHVISIDEQNNEQPGPSRRC